MEVQETPPMKKEITSPSTTIIDHKERGRKSRAKGQRFEAKVRKELEEMGWVVTKWMNTVEYEKEGNMGKLAPAKRKYNPFLKTMIIGTGFPDFVCFRRDAQGKYDVFGLEVKGNGYLDQMEKGMCTWLFEHKIFSKILIARRSKTRGKVDYIDFEKRYLTKKTVATPSPDEAIIDDYVREYLSLKR